MTPTRRPVLPFTTSTAKPPPASARRAFTGTASTWSARWVVTLTFTGAWSRVAPSGGRSRRIVTGTVGVDELPEPPGLAGRLVGRAATAAAAEADAAAAGTE